MSPSLSMSATSMLLVESSVATVWRVQVPVTGLSGASNQYTPVSVPLATEVTMSGLPSPSRSAT